MYIKLALIFVAVIKFARVGARLNISRIIYSCFVDYKLPYKLGVSLLPSVLRNVKQECKF